jgi:hypothetical protein
LIKKYYYAQHLERIQRVNTLPKNGVEKLSGNKTLEGAPHKGWPTVIDGEFKAVPEPDSSRTCQEFAQSFNVSDETIRLHLRQMGKAYKLSKWIPHELTADNKVHGLAISLLLLSRHSC